MVTREHVIMHFLSYLFPFEKYLRNVKMVIVFQINFLSVPRQCDHEISILHQ